MHIFTAEMHIRYLQKVVTMHEHRLPRILANYLLQERRQLVIEWETLTENCLTVARCNELILLVCSLRDSCG